MSRIRNIVIVGAGFFGCTVAERVAKELSLPVTVLDRRRHPGGNSWSETDPETGIEVHCYGSHIFHTAKENVWNYITRFTAFNEYRHSVYTRYCGEIYSLPVNLGTINHFYRAAMSPGEARKFIADEAAKENIREPRNLEEKAVSMIGRPLYEAFFRGYTMKQWEKDPKELPPSIITRLPVRFRYNNRYFSDPHEGIPLDGYGALFRRMLDHPLIDLKLGVDFREFRGNMPPDSLIVYTGAIDEYFGWRLGRLEWRTVDFEAERRDCPDYQGTSVINEADPENPFTRTHEFKHYHPERPQTGKTIVYRERSRRAAISDEPYYPVLTSRNLDLFAEYERLARQEPDVVFGGRLGSYRYFDMDGAISAALECFESLKPRLSL